MIWDLAINTRELASEANYIYPIATEFQIVVEKGYEFKIANINENIIKKISEKSTQSNPFLPYQKIMFVKNIGELHVCLLNRFPVVKEHLLVCTKDYESQTRKLTVENFKAWLQGINPNAWGFYNSGKDAGASQAHRHMQLIKTPFLLESMYLKNEVSFRCSIDILNGEQLSASAIYERYLQAMDKLNLHVANGLKPYNILLSKNVLVVIPRTKNNHASVFLNGLNYGGIFLFREQKHLEAACSYGLINILQACTE